MLRVPIRYFLCGQSASTREREWHWTNRCLTRPNGGVSLCVYTRELLAKRARGLRRLHHDILMRLASGIQASGENMGTQVTEHPGRLANCLASEFAGLLLLFFVMYHRIDLRTRVLSCKRHPRYLCTGLRAKCPRTWRVCW